MPTLSRQDMQACPEPVSSERMTTAGDMSASELFRRYSRFLAGFLERLGVSRDDCPDLVQDIFLIAHKRGGYRVGAASPRSWLANIALGEARNLRRKRHRRATDSDSDSIAGVPDPSMAANPEWQAGTRRDLHRVKAALDALHEPHRVVFMLYELEGEPCSSIAAGLGIPKGTVYSRLHAARQGFRAAFERTGDARPLAGDFD